MTREDFDGLVKDLFEEYLPKVGKADKNSFIQALAAELQDMGLDIEDEGDEDDSDDDDVEELNF